MRDGNAVSPPLLDRRRSTWPSLSRTSEATWSEGVLRVAVPAARIDAMLRASWLIPLIVWAILLLPTLAVAYLLTRSITTPIERLQHMTARVAAGEFGYRTSVRTQGRVGRVGGVSE